MFATYFFVSCARPYIPIAGVDIDYVRSTTTAWVYCVLFIVNGKLPPHFRVRHLIKTWRKHKGNGLPLLVAATIWQGFHVDNRPSSFYDFISRFIRRYPTGQKPHKVLNASELPQCQQ
jgi:hypothetical protein